MNGMEVASVRRKVMVVDDDPLMLQVVERLLARRNIELVSTSRAIGVMSLIARSRPDVVLLDVNMPALDGPSLVSLIREDPEIRDTTVVLHSALPEAELQRKAEACGADGYIAKTLGVVHLERAIERWCALRSP